MGRAAAPPIGPARRRGVAAAAAGP